MAKYKENESKPFNYYQSELNRIDIKAPTIDIVITDYHGNRTKYLGLNDSSIKELREFLDAVERELNNPIVINYKK